jgi:hypothetical protein
MGKIFVLNIPSLKGKLARKVALPDSSMLTSFYQQKIHNALSTDDIIKAKNPPTFVAIVCRL